MFLFSHDEKRNGRVQAEGEDGPYSDNGNREGGRGLLTPYDLNVFRRQELMLLFPPGLPFEPRFSESMFVYAAGGFEKRGQSLCNIELARIVRFPYIPLNDSLEGNGESMLDPKTVEYFDRNLCEYSLERMDYVVNVLQRTGRPDHALVDIGCGTGNTIEMLAKTTPIRYYTGIDPSMNFLNLCRERNNCRTYLGSILDRSFIEGIPERYDFALLGAVLHHLVGKTRRQSRRYALRAIENALELLKPGGILLVAEPTFSPALIVDGVFYLKRAMAGITSKRMPLGSHWQNIGAPVVSYYTRGQLMVMISSIPGAELTDCHFHEKSWNIFPMNLLKGHNATMVVKRSDGRV